MLDGGPVDPAGYIERAACPSVGVACEVRAIASSTRSSHTKRIRLLAFFGTSSRSLRLRAGSMTVAIPAWIAANEVRKAGEEFLDTKRRNPRQMI